MTYPTNLIPADIAAVRAANLPRLLAAAESIQHAISRFPVVLEKRSEKDAAK